ncbi:hypothetical protein HanOQP8_Chr15g0594711 [Helianthus annuus]|nr:hypothetical protein HanOQP8_Chr15g0594711 [Helianthus annuus]
MAVYPLHFEDEVFRILAGHRLHVSEPHCSFVLYAMLSLNASSCDLLCFDKVIGQYTHAMMLGDGRLISHGNQ